jgi:rare lipoprotein A
METKVLATLLTLLTLALGCGKQVVPLREGDTAVGYASWYGDQFHGKKTASGERYDMYQFTAAHRTIPFGSNLRVINLDNQKSVVVRINDRGPFVRGRIIDLSLAAAREIGLVGTGTARVRLELAGATQETSRFFVQAGSFREVENARQMVQLLSERFPSRPSRIEPADGLNRVWFGPMETEEEATRCVEELEDAGVAAFILRR